MADSDRKSSLNKDTFADNETIFDFLKRKKQVGLQHTVNKSLHSSTKKKHEIDVEELPHTRDLSKYYTHDMSSKYARTAKPQTITPHKIQFQDRQRASENVQSRIQKEHEYAQQQQNVVANPSEQSTWRGKSFLSMISPVKARASSALQERNQQKENQNKNVYKSGAKGSKSDNYVRRNLTKSIGAVKETINQLARNINTIKEKSHALAVIFNPILTYLTQGNHPVTRQVGELRNKFHNFESLIGGVSSQTCDLQLQNFHRTLEQHLQTIENEIRRQAARSKNQEVLQLKNQKQALIQKLQSQLKKVLKDNQLLIRKLQKTENSKGVLQQTVTQREINYVQQLEKMRSHYEASIEQLQAKNQDLQVKLKSSSQQIKFLQQEHKNQKMLKQSLKSKFREEMQQITEAKDAYLLNQIIVLKAEFSADLTRLNQLHKIKQAELHSRIQNKDEQVNQKMLENGCNKQIQLRIMQEANAIKQQNLQLKTQADCIITDMYRMNEQLYQHWIALKDIKVLSTRLGSFAQYRQIYQDLAFNEHLFQ